VWLALYLAGYRIAHENGLMENQQALCLALAALMFALAARGQSTRPDKLFCVSLMLFCFMFLLRELELKGERAPHWVQFILTSKPKKILLASCWLLLLIVALRHVRPICQAFVRWLRTPAGCIMIVGGIFYGLTWPFDKELFNLPKSQNMFLEELGDSIATMLILLSGVWTWRATAPSEDDPQA